MIDQSKWGGVAVSSSPRKVSATFKVDNQGNLIPTGSFGGETPAEKNQRIREERARKLGLK
jgi:hypothetical protein